MQDVSYNTKFWKLLEKAQKQDVDWAGTPRWADEAGGPVPPFFPDLKECQQCTAGAADAKSRGSGPLFKPTLVCLNKSCYDQKCETGATVYREKMEAHKKGIYREGRELVMRYVSELAPLSAEALRALATSLLHEIPRFEMQHPFGVWHENWSYEAGATAKDRELLRIELTTVWRGPDYLEGTALATLDHIDPGDLRELVANLMVHHLRIAGRIYAVARGTPTDVHIFQATEEQGQLSDIANPGVEVIAETLCGEMVDVQHGVGWDNKTL